jgi:hypothetical protein
MHAQMTRTARPARRAAQVLACVLVLALLCSQWLGMVHRVVHVPMPVLAGVQAHKTLQTSTLTSPVIQGRAKVEASPATGAVARDAAELAMSTPTGVLAHVATPAKSDQDCRLYDQLGVSDALTALPLLWAAQVFKAYLASPVVHCHTPGAVLVTARGPPLNF